MDNNAAAVPHRHRRQPPPKPATRPIEELVETADHSDDIAPFASEVHKNAVLLALKKMNFAKALEVK
jgi:hypothetical protein